MKRKGKELINKFIESVEAHQAIIKNLSESLPTHLFSCHTLPLQEVTVGSPDCSTVSFPLWEFVTG
jgi:hypothetical protein